MDTGWYKTIIMWMQCAFGVMLGAELAVIAAKKGFELAGEIQRTQKSQA